MWLKNAITTFILGSIVRGFQFTISLLSYVHPSGGSEFLVSNKLEVYFFNLVNYSMILNNRIVLFIGRVITNHILTTTVL